MKKSVKSIIGLSALLLALGGGAAALMLTEPKEDGDSSSSTVSEPEKQVKVLIHDDKVTGTDPETGADLKGTIKTVKVKNATDEFYVVQNGRTATGSGIVYTFDGYQNISMDTAMIGTLANNANGLTSEDVIEENCTDIAKFGLDKPEAVVDIEYETGTKFRMLVGDKTPTGDTKYVMIDGIDTVYTVRLSAVANYSNTFDDFVDKTMLKAPDVYPTVEKLTISRKDHEKDMV